MDGSYGKYGIHYVFASLLFNTRSLQLLDFYCRGCLWQPSGLGDRVRSPRRSREDRHSQIHNLGGFGMSQEIWELGVQAFFSLARKPDIKKRAAARQMAESATLKAGQ